MKLLTKAIEAKLPAMYTTDGQGEEAVAQVKFFTPDAGFTFYGTEYDPEIGQFFGLTIANPGTTWAERELGYFDMNMLKTVTGHMGLHIERDMHFSPTPLKECN
jgi:hypothetical protein